MVRLVLRTGLLALVSIQFSRCFSSVPLFASLPFRLPSRPECSRVPLPQSRAVRKVYFDNVRRQRFRLEFTDYPRLVLFTESLGKPFVGKTVLTWTVGKGFRIDAVDSE